MPQKIKIKVLVENMATGRGIRGEHGLATWIEADDRCFLFDVGQSDLFVHNGKILGVPWDEAECIALSHGHYDHAGGLASVPGLSKKMIVAHPDAWSPHCARGRGHLSFIGSSLSRAQAGERSAGLIDTRTPFEVLPGVWLSGEIPRPHSFETPSANRNFYLDLPGRPPDLILDDQALFIESPKGLIVVLGCAHSGILNTLEYADSFGKKLYAVVGGLHLIGATPERLEKTLCFLENLGLEKIVAGHCTGWKACHRLESAFGERFSLLHSGQVIEF